VNQTSNKRNNPVGLEVVQNIRGHHRRGHAASSDRGNDVGNNVVLSTLLGQSLGETDLTQLGSGVVGLAEATEETSSGGSVDNATKLLFAEVRPSSTSALLGESIYQYWHLEGIFFGYR
jgi:hypothetical protein